MGYRLQGCKELDMTEVTEHAHTYDIQYSRLRHYPPGAHSHGRLWDETAGLWSTASYLCDLGWVAKPLCIIIVLIWKTQVIIVRTS